MTGGLVPVQSGGRWRQACRREGPRQLPGANLPRSLETRTKLLNHQMTLCTQWHSDCLSYRSKSISNLILQTV